MNLHRKSAKHVKMNRTSFVSQNFFKCLQQIGETEMLSRVNLVENVPYSMLSCLLPYIFKIFILNKKVWFLIFIQNAINLKHHVKSEID